MDRHGVRFEIHGRLITSTIIVEKFSCHLLTLYNIFFNIQKTNFTKTSTSKPAQSQKSQIVSLLRVFYRFSKPVPKRLLSGQKLS